MNTTETDRDWLADLRTAGAFLTILPVGGRNDYRPGGLAAAAWCFPLIGLLAGAVGGLVYALAVWLGCGAWLAATLCVAALVLFTGSLHEDGLGDFADAMGGPNRERRLAIMHDSQAGNFAIVALLLLFAARIGVIAELGTPERVGSALLVAAAVSRTAMVIVMRLLPTARTDGLSAGAGRPGDATTISAAVIAILIAVPLLGFTVAVAALLGAAVPAIVLAAVAHGRLGGQTGDVLGAVQLVAEFGALFAVALLS
ncbi:MAG: adenosylcobinamide-GDP ribazoletransferase [Rhodospirillaceae bacterium]|nr:adenosylcobinamide-GDP ribazoletransferase [Rhodospirillaceae bacterium]MBT5894447.1 adenosylcobinamide-GDP ribazoletransferase [Rhodospirillaceae bacterium]MBT6429350.1 adenosylcobinamide-GDP ribazoletransferase [Rhodospirillaceae bacterium]MBT7760274.1 adenosylcobinamide-GDP ribazoletransferase [Rhodospirillaceae bacterium]